MTCSHFLRSGTSLATRGMAIGKIGYQIIYIQELVSNPIKLSITIQRGDEHFKP